jgi:TPR repeat protein
MGNLYYLGKDVEQDDALAADYFLMAAQQGHDGGQFGLGVLIEQMRVKLRTPIDADVLFQLAAEQGHVEAQFRLGCLYLQGKGVAKCKETASIWLSTAGNNGHAGAVTLMQDVGIIQKKPVEATPSI